MKKWRVAVLVLLALLMSILMISYAYAEPAWTDAKYFEFDRQTGTILKYSMDGPRDVVIPEAIGGTKVTAIGIQAFAYQQLTSVKIPDSVIVIGDGAFLYNWLKSVQIPDSVTEIGELAFYNNELTDVRISNAVTSIQFGTFSYNQLTSLEIPSSVTMIGREAFYNNHLERVEIPNSVISIGEGAFGRNQLMNVTIPNSVKEIRKGAFQWNKLPRVEVAKDCQVHEKAFHPETEVVRRDLEEDLTWTDAKYFVFDKETGTILRYSTNGPRDVVIPPVIDGTAVKVIGGAAFLNQGLTSVKIPNSVLEIGAAAFSRNQLTVLMIPNSVRTIEDGAFSHNQLNRVVISDSVKRIGELAFRDNKLHEVEIPNNCYIHPLAFEDNVNLIPRVIDQALIKEGFFTFNLSDGAIVGYAKEAPQEVEIPAVIRGVSVRKIGDWVFEDRHLTRVVIPDSVSVIGDSAFSKNLLTEIRLPASLIEIGEKAFYSNQLNEVRIPNSVKSIGGGAFASNRLRSVALPSSITVLERGVFSGNALTQVRIPSSVIRIEEAALYRNHLTSVEIPSSVRMVGKNAFVQNFLEKVELPKDCTVHREAFDPDVLVVMVGEEDKLFDDRVIRDVNYSWTVQFNTDIDPVSVTKDNFLIQDEQGKILDGIEPMLVDGSPSKVQMRNHTIFEKNKDYYIVVKKEVATRQGQKMKQNVRMKFRVE